MTIPAPVDPHSIECRDLTPAEADKVARLHPAFAGRFATGGPTPVACRADGDGPDRLIFFQGADGRNVGSVQADDFLAAADDEAAGLISPWVG